MGIILAMIDSSSRLSPVVSGLYVENVHAMECIESAHESAQALMRPEAEGFNVCHWSVLKIMFSN